MSAAASSNVDSLKQALKKMEPLRERLSALLREPDARRRGRVINQERVWFRLAFVAHKLSAIVAVLRRQLEKLPIYDDSSETTLQMQELARLAEEDVGRLLDAWEQAPRCALPWRKAGAAEAIERNFSWLVWKGLLLTNQLARDARSTSMDYDGPELPRQDSSEGGGRRCPLVGIDCAKKKLGRWLEEDDGLKVISIVGPAGVGKTTLALEMYGEISGQFDCLVTAKMSRRPHKEQFLRHILSQANTNNVNTPSTDQTDPHSSVMQMHKNNSQISIYRKEIARKWRLPNLKPSHQDLPTRTKAKIDPATDQMELVSSIKQSLKNKRYLVLIDDIWDTSDLALKSSTLRENKLIKAWDVEEETEKGRKKYPDKEESKQDEAKKKSKEEYHGKGESKEDQAQKESKEDGAMKESKVEYQEKEESKDRSLPFLIKAWDIEEQAQKGNKEDQGKKVIKHDLAKKESSDYQAKKESKEEYKVEEENKDKSLTLLDDWEFKGWSLSEHKKDWEIIKDAFPDDGLGSRIIVTTRITSIARSCCSASDGFVHEVQPLNEQDSESLLLAEAFGSKDALLPERTRRVCDEILRRCEGIPLFITRMAEKIKRVQERSTVCSLEEVPQLLDQLEHELCYNYNDLFYGLELLPLSMSTVFPQGCMIDKERLIRAWVREGLIYSENWRDCKMKAEQCFSELVDRNIIRLATFPGVKENCLCQMDPFVHRFLVSKSAKVNFVTTISMVNPARSAPGGRGVRRLSIEHPEPPKLPADIDLSSTESLTVSGAAKWVPLDKLKSGSLKSLVVLDLEGWNNLTDKNLFEVCSSVKPLQLKHLSVRNTHISKVPPEIEGLWQLRALDLGGCTEISDLPPQMCRLKQLESLDLRSTGVKQLPEQIGDLQGLRQLLVGGDRAADPYGTAAEIHIPEGIRRMAELHTLATVDLSWCPASFIEETLGGLYSLRVVSITWSRHQCADEVHQGALRSSISRWERLKSLSIHCGQGCSMDFLASLPHPPQELERLQVTAGRFPSVPQWINGLNHLAFLQITVCSLAPDGLEILGTLPMLERLVLVLDYLPGEAAVIHGGMGFRRLLRLTVDCRVPWLDFRQGAMRRLTHFELAISRVPGPARQQQSVPSGIRNLISLERVDVRYNAWYLNTYCVKATVNAIRKQVAKLHFLVNLVINGIQDDVQAILREAEEKRTTPP